MAKLGPWTCDECGGDVVLDEGFVVWARLPTGDGDFRVIHKERCDPGNRSHAYSQSLADFVGVDGLTNLMSFLSLGPLKDTLGDSRPGPRPSDLDEFVDFVRRMQIPGYEQVRHQFNDPVILERFSDANETYPYMQEAIDVLLAEQEESL